MADEKIDLNLDDSHLIARLIWDFAVWEARCVPPETPAMYMHINPEHIRAAANLTFLMLDLIAEWKQSHD